MADPAAPLPAGLDTQPVALLVSGLVGVIDLGIAAADALGWLDLTIEQTAAVATFVAGAGALIGATLRQLVFCRATVRHDRVTR
jgi:hypothetical protein